MDIAAVQDAFGTFLLDLALAVLSLGGAYAVSYIRLAADKARVQTAQLRDDSARAVLDAALDDVQRLAELSVGAMEQTTAKRLREQVKQGAAGRGELLKLGAQVFDEVKGKVLPEAQDVITRNLGSFDGYLSACIENAVHRVKQADPAACLGDPVFAAMDE